MMGVFIARIAYQKRRQQLSKIKLSTKQLERRILQPTADLMDEVGGVIQCGRSAYAYRQTGAPVLAVAHCDYRDCGSDHFYRGRQRGQDIVLSSRLDDRLGVYVILDVLPSLGIKCDVLLTDDEEKGQSTAQHFEPDNHSYNWLFQFDRHGTGAVTYDYESMEPFVSEFFKLEWGSFSDISFLEHLGVGGVNVGTAYYEEHTLGSYAVLSQLASQIQKFVGFYKQYQFHRVEHVAESSAPWWASHYDEPVRTVRVGAIEYAEDSDGEWHPVENDRDDLYDQWRSKWYDDMK
jgi:hypothetical protein